MDRDRIFACIRKMTPMYWFTRPSTNFILKNCQQKNIVGIEIGVDYGLNARTMLKLLPIKTLYLVDPYEEELDTVSGDKRYEKAQKFLARFKNKIEFVRKTSDAAADVLPNNLDFVYIDGSHEYKFVKRDIDLYYPKVKKGGIIGGHDFWASQIGVCKAVLEFAEKHNLKLQGAITDWWIVKP